MNQYMPSRWSVVVPLLFFIVGIFYLTLFRLLPPQDNGRVRLPELSKEDSNKLVMMREISDLLGEGLEGANALQSAGNHRLAAISLEHISGAYIILLPDEQKKEGERPTQVQLLALKQYSLANDEVGEAYKKLLQFEYPKWNSTKRQVANH